MPIKGLDDAKRHASGLVGRIEVKAERTIREVLAIARGYADAMVPVATSTLVNSQFIRVETQGDKIKGMIGFTAAYAAAVHAAKGTLKGTNTPRRPASLGNVWDGASGPNGAEPGFLRRAFEEDGKADIDAAIKRGMSL